MSADSIVLITGCSTGFGRVTAETLARKKYRVFAGMRAIQGRNAANARDLEALRVVVSRDRPPAPFSKHAGEEWLYVVRGPLRLEYGPDDYTLSAGTTAHFDAARPHRLNAVRHEAEVLLVATAPRKDLHNSHR